MYKGKWKILRYCKDCDELVEVSSTGGKVCKKCREKNKQIGLEKRKKTEELRKLKGGIKDERIFKKSDEF